MTQTPAQNSILRAESRCCLPPMLSDVTRPGLHPFLVHLYPKPRNLPRRSPLPSPDLRCHLRSGAPSATNSVLREIKIMMTRCNAIGAFCGGISAAWIVLALITTPRIYSSHVRNASAEGELRDSKSHPNLRAAVDVSGLISPQTGSAQSSDPASSRPACPGPSCPRRPALSGTLQRARRTSTGPLAGQRVPILLGHMHRFQH